MSKADSPVAVFAYLGVKPTDYRIKTLLILLSGSLYGVLLAGSGAGLGSTVTDKVLALSILGASATGRISGLLFAMSASLSGIAWARRVIDLGFGNMQLTEYMVLGMVINVVLHFIVHPVSMPKQLKRLILFAFLPASAFALAASIGGWVNGNPEYVRPLRACLVVVGFLYAFLNITNIDRARRVFFGVVYLAVMTYLIRLGVLPFLADVPKGLGPFLLAAPVISILLLSKITPVIRMCIILAVLLFALMSTFTIFLSVALVVALFCSYHARGIIIRRLMLFCLIAYTLAMIFVGVSVVRDELISGVGATVMEMDAVVSQGEFFTAPLDRIRYKVYDRLVLWIPAIVEVADAPFELNAGARPLVIQQLSGVDEGSWTIHVHNVFIEVMRQFSLPGSIFFNVLIFAALITLWRSLKQRRRYDSYLLAWSLFGLSFLPGFIFGFYPVAGEIGIYFWLACGISYKLRLSDNQNQTTYQ